MNLMRIFFSEETCQDDDTELNCALILFSKVIFFPLPSLVRPRRSPYLTTKIEKIWHDTLDS